jgi:hypothetical protein
VECGKRRRDGPHTAIVYCIVRGRATRDTPPLLESVRLRNWLSGKAVWPPPTTFASNYVQSLPMPLHAGPAWSDPVYQERRPAELVSEQRRNAAYHEQAGREQEQRQNRELKEQFLARQRA